MHFWNRFCGGCTARFSPGFFRIAGFCEKKNLKMISKNVDEILFLGNFSLFLLIIFPFLEMIWKKNWSKSICPISQLYKNQTIAHSKCTPRNVHLFSTFEASLSLDVCHSVSSFPWWAYDFNMCVCISVCIPRFLLNMQIN